MYISCVKTFTSISFLSLLLALYIYICHWIDRYTYTSRWLFFFFWLQKYFLNRRFNLINSLFRNTYLVTIFYYFIFFFFYNRMISCTKIQYFYIFLSLFSIHSVVMLYMEIHEYDQKCRISEINPTPFVMLRILHVVCVWPSPSLT